MSQHPYLGKFTLTGNVVEELQGRTVSPGRGEARYWFSMTGLVRARGGARAELVSRVDFSHLKRQFARKSPLLIAKCHLPG